jgi:hypothetical protein
MGREVFWSLGHDPTISWLHPTALDRPVDERGIFACNARPPGCPRRGCQGQHFRNLPIVLNANAVAIPTIKEAPKFFFAKELDAFATNKPILYELADELPGSRVLAGRSAVENVAIAISKGRKLGYAFLRTFTDNVKKKSRGDSAITHTSAQVELFLDCERPWSFAVGKSFQPHSTSQGISMCFN